MATRSTTRSTMRPPGRPELARTTAEGWASAAGVAGGAYLVGRRGYYRDTMGRPGKNEVGVYDDAIALVAPTTYRTFNANTDPSRLYPGVAVLEPGVWLYQVGTHGLSRPKAQRYTALVQAAAVTVRRHDGGPSSGWFGINIHRGGEGTTGSAGCQTIPPDQWDEFLAAVKAALTETGQRVIPYVLTVRPDLPP